MTKNLKQGILFFVTLALALPVLAVTLIALVNAYNTSKDAPFRIVLGNERYQELRSGAGGFPHYLGANRSVPDAALQTRKGDAWKLGEQGGKVTVLNFWTKTCQPCLEEFPRLQELAELTKNWGDVQVVAVSVDPTWAEIDDIIANVPDVRHLLDPKHAVVLDLFGTKLFPETWIIDKNGLIRFRFDGTLDWSSPVVLDLVRSFR